PFVNISNKVIISDQVFRELPDPLRSRFLKWKQSPELGVDFFIAGDRLPADSAICSEIPDGPKISSPDPSTPVAKVSMRTRPTNLAQRQVFALLKSRTTLIA